MSVDHSVRHMTFYYYCYISPLMWSAEDNINLRCLLSVIK
jgi:hypothetical protein